MKINPIVATFSTLSVLAVSALFAVSNLNVKALAEAPSQYDYESKDQAKSQNQQKWLTFKTRLEEAIKNNDYEAFKALQTEAKTLHKKHKVNSPNSNKPKKGNWKAPTEEQQKARFDAAVAKYAKDGTFPFANKGKGHGHGKHFGNKGHGLGRNNQVAPQ